MSKIYIAGPMSGLPGFNRPAFHRAAAHTETLGLDIQHQMIDRYMGAR